MCVLLLSLLYLLFDKGGIIKAGDTLLFDVELLAFHEKPKERWEMSAEELMTEATKTKVQYSATVRALLGTGIARYLALCGTGR